MTALEAQMSLVRLVDKEKINYYSNFILCQLIAIDITL